jgi:hypothetical protein
LQLDNLIRGLTLVAFGAAAGLFVLASVLLARRVPVGLPSAARRVLLPLLAVSLSFLGLGSLLIRANAASFSALLQPAGNGRATPPLFIPAGPGRSYPDGIAVHAHK